ncbi:hypothetical protein IG7_01982 [Bacillus cereus HuA2-4]|nr:hypothetical protein IG7_01982 [Bacillus cereus HuA2-4]
MSYSIPSVSNFLSNSGIKINPGDVVCLFGGCDSGTFNPSDLIEVPIGNNPNPIKVPKNDYLKYIMGFETEEFQKISEEAQRVAKRIFDAHLTLPASQIVLINTVAENATAMVQERLNNNEDGNQLANMIGWSLAGQERLLIHPEYRSGTLALPNDIESCAIIVSAACIVVGTALLAEHPIAGGLLILGAEGIASSSCRAIYD